MLGARVSRLFASSVNMIIGVQRVPRRVRCCMSVATAHSFLQRQYFTIVSIARLYGRMRQTLLIQCTLSILCLFVVIVREIGAVDMLQAETLAWMHSVLTQSTHNDTVVLQG